MINHSINDGVDSITIDTSKGWNLIILSLATTIDALFVGLGLAFTDIAIVMTCAMIGLKTLFFHSSEFL